MKTANPPQIKFPPTCCLCGHEMVKADKHPQGWIAYQCGPHEPDGNYNVNVVTEADDKARRARAS
jgi:hypothetical protein